MITGAIKNKIDRIWTDIWAGGITNPLTVIEQLSYIMFIHELDKRETVNERKAEFAGIKADLIFPQTESGQMMRWSRFKNRDPEEIFRIVSERVFTAVKNMRGGSLPDVDDRGNIVPPLRSDGGDGSAQSDIAGEDVSAFARFMEGAEFRIPSPLLLQRIIAGLDELYEDADVKDRDMLGDIYEYMLSKISTSGQNGQFRTPAHIRNMMVELIAPTPDDVICDPACGTAGFLNSAGEYIRKRYEGSMTPEQWTHFGSSMFTGFDTDVTMLRISAMNLMLHSITRPNICYSDSVSKKNTVRDKFTVCLANPPFKGTVDASGIADDLKSITGTKKTELLFLALFLRLLSSGGRCACIVPDGVLFGSSSAHTAIRRELIENHKLQAVISMPSGVFKPYAGVSTAVLIFTKTGAGGTDKVWFYGMEHDGFTLDDKRTKTEEDDIPDVLKRFACQGIEESRSRSDKSFFVPKDEIAANGYDLSINKYRRTEYTPAEYEPADVILSDIEAAESEIAAGLAELRAMLAAGDDAAQMHM